jgi:hypothetical protein
LGFDVDGTFVEEVRGDDDDFITVPDYDTEATLPAAAATSAANIRATAPSPDFSYSDEESEYMRVLRLTGRRAFGLPALHESERLKAIGTAILDEARATRLSNMIEAYEAYALRLAEEVGRLTEQTCVLTMEHTLAKKNLRYSIASDAYTLWVRLLDDIQQSPYTANITESSYNALVAKVDAAWDEVADAAAELEGTDTSDDGDGK